jgi:hypothetical protein
MHRAYIDSDVDTASASMDSRARSSSCDSAQYFDEPKITFLQVPQRSNTTAPSPSTAQIIRKAARSTASRRIIWPSTKLRAPPPALLKKPQKVPQRKQPQQAISTKPQSTMSKCPCDCKCGKLTAGGKLCRFCGLKVCAKYDELRAPDVEIAPAPLLNSRAIVRLHDGKWVMQSDFKSIYRTTDLALLRFVQTPNITMESTVLQGINALLRTPMLTSADINMIPNASIPGSTAGDLYLVQLPEGALIESSLTLLQIDPQDLEIHRACSMRTRDAITATLTWETTVLQTDSSQDFQSARRGVNNTRD